MGVYERKPSDKVIRSPAKGKNGELIHVEVFGPVCQLRVGRYQHKFILQRCPITGAVEKLTHYASGMVVGSLREFRVSAYLGRGSRITDRDAAKALIASAIAKNGAERVNVVINSAAVIN